MTFLKVMSGTLSAVGRKILSLALIFNSLVSLVSVANLLVAFYFNAYAWQPYSPYLINGSLFWFTILTAILNIVPAKIIGKVNLKRILFHHYVYGFLASSISLLLIAFFAPTYLFVLLMPSLGFQMSGFQIMPVYAALVCVYGGLTLIIDDINDVSQKISRTLDKIKVRASRSGKVLQTLHLLSSIISFYVVVCIVLWCTEHGVWMKTGFAVDLSHIVFVTSLFITSLWGLKAVKAKIWFMNLYADLSRAEDATSA